MRGGSMSSWDEEMFTMMGGSAAFAVLLSRSCRGWCDALGGGNNVAS